MARYSHYPITKQSVSVYEQTFDWSVKLSIDTALDLYNGQLHKLIQEYLDNQRRQLENNLASQKELKAQIARLEKLGFK